MITRHDKYNAKVAPDASFAMTKDDHKAPQLPALEFNVASLLDEGLFPAGWEVLSPHQLSERSVSYNFIVEAVQKPDAVTFSVAISPRPSRTTKGPADVQPRHLKDTVPELRAESPKKHTSRTLQGTTTGISIKTMGPWPPKALVDSTKNPSSSLLSTSSLSTTASCYKEQAAFQHAEAAAPDCSAIVTTREQLQVWQSKHPLPPTSDHGGLAKARYVGMTFYRRLMALVILSNFAILAVTIARYVSSTTSFTYARAATATGANLTAAVLMRQEHIVNLLFHLACAVPYRAPLAVRRVMAKMAYNNGGVHSGATISALLWYIFYDVLVVKHFHGTDAEIKALFVVCGMTLVLFTTLIALAHPAFRRKHHDLWELSHRFGGWTAIALVWAQILIIAIADAQTAHIPLSHNLITLPTFWFLIIITICLIYPWLRLKRLPVHATKLSNHATQLHFTDRQLPTCRGIRLAHNPLLECHGFATIPNPPPPAHLHHDHHSNSPADPDPEKGYTVLISHAGDFTRKMIRSPPTHIWARGAPTTGVMRLSSLFRPLIIVATGSGIGPCLSFLNVHRSHPQRVIWSARDPLTTYGVGIMADVLAADPKALVVDTKKTGTPDLVGLTYACVREMGAEAVMVISNPKVTKEVVFGMEARKIAAFGAIFDS